MDMCVHDGEKLIVVKIFRFFKLIYRQTSKIKAVLLQLQHSLVHSTLQCIIARAWKRYIENELHNSFPNCVAYQ